MKSSASSGRRSRRARSVHVRPACVRSRRDRSASSGALGDVAGVLDRQEAQPRAERRRSLARRPPAGRPAGRRRRSRRRSGRRPGACAACGRGRCPCPAGSVACSPSRCSSTEAPCPPGGCPARPGRAAADRRAGSTLRAAVPIASASASETCPASSITSVSSVLVELLRRTARRSRPAAGRRRRRRRTPRLVELVIGVAVVLGLGVAALRLLEPAEAHAVLRAPPARSRRAGCGSPCGSVAATPTRRPLADELDDDPRARPRLAGAGRPLDEEVARVERGRALALLVEVASSAARADAAGEPRPRSRERCPRAPR